MQKIAIRISNLGQLNAAVNAARECQEEITLTDGGTVVDAKRFDGVVNLSLVLPVIMTIDSDDEDIVEQIKSNLVDGQFVGYVVDIYEGSPEAEAIANALEGVGNKKEMKDEKEAVH